MAVYGDIENLPTGIEREGCRATMTIAVIRYGRIALLSVYLNIYAKCGPLRYWAENGNDLTDMKIKANLQNADNMLFIWQKQRLTVDSLFLADVTMILNVQFSNLSQSIGALAPVVKLQHW